MGGRTDVVVATLARARTLAGRPVPDALIVAAAMGADAVALATFDRGQTRYGFPVVMPSSGEGR
jgi:predicted nucleic acid-binding protein